MKEFLNYCGSLLPVTKAQEMITHKHQRIDNILLQYKTLSNKYTLKVFGHVNIFKSVTQTTCFCSNIKYIQ